MKMEEIKKKLEQINFDGVNFRKIAIISACTLVGGLIFSLGLFPALIKSLIRQNMQLKPGSPIRGMFENIPFPLDFKMYLFHVLNPDEIMKGGKPRVREIGPYFFEEWKEKYDTEDNDEDDTMTFNLKTTWIFRPDMSAPLTGNEIVTIPHPLILGALLMIQRDKEAMLPMISKALEIVLHPMTSGFLTTRVMDLLFDGVPIDCSSDEFEAVALCAALDSEGAVKQHNDTHVKFSMFATKNGTDGGRFKVYRGIKNVMDIGRMVSYNDETEMDLYDGDECNKYIGTDSTIFPPLLTKKDKLWAWSPDICQSLGAFYAGKSSYAGLPMSVYKMEFGDLRNDPVHQCFCRNPPDGCPPAGTIDLSACVKAPIIASKPHFLGADPKLLAAVDGLTPNEKDHDIFIYFHLLSGSAVSAAKRLQFNMEMEPIRDHELLGKLPKVIFPMFWAEEGISLNKTWTNQLKYTLFLGLRINAAIKWISIIIGTIGTIGAGFMYHHHSTKAVKVITVKPDKENSGKPRGNGVAPVSTNKNGTTTAITNENNKNSTVVGHVTIPVIPAGKDMVTVNNIRNLPTVIEALDKSPKANGAEVQKERY